MYFTGFECEEMSFELKLTFYNTTYESMKMTISTMQYCM